MWYIIPGNYGGMYMKKIIALFLAIILIVGATVFCYAKEIYGDIDKNGVVNSSDALKILQYSVGSLKNINFNLADINHDLKVNSSDSLLVLQISVGQRKPETVSSSSTTTKKTTTKTTTKAATKITTKTTTKATTKSSSSKALYTASQFKKAGVVYWNGYRWTWYSQRVLPGTGLKIPGRHVDENGYVCDSNNYICLASSTLSKGTVVSTPFGKAGKVYDSGCAAGTLDVYTNF